MFYIYHSNKLKIHKKFISDLIRNDPLVNVFEQEIILVQNTIMSQWLQIELAQILGIAANISFITPKIFIWKMFTSVLSEVPKENIFSKNIITWKLMKILPSILHRSEFESLRQYLNKDTNQRKLYQLSNHIADLFCQYLVYRPQWLESWCKKQLVKGLSDDQYWQKYLWLELINYTKKLNQSECHIANIYKKFMQNLQLNTNLHIFFPKRIFICGISTLPLIYLNVLNALSKYIDIHLMVVNPCCYYWGNIQNYVSNVKYKKHILKNYNNQNKNYFLSRKSFQPTLFKQKSTKQFLINPLLVSWGKLGSDNIYFLSKLKRSNNITTFINSSCNTLLHQIQNDILNLENHAQLGLTKKDFCNSFLKRQLNKKDNSITFHSCYSKQREVEVLQDYLLCLFDKNTTLMPKDIIVMVTDIDSYAPYIQAVFSCVSEERYLPFSILNQKNFQKNSILQTFISLLDLPQSRFTSEEVFSLLETPILAQQFSISNNELLLLRRWINESGIRWGLDDENITMFGLPAVGQNTWSFGLNRMLLSCAMSSQSGIWNKILPYDECKGVSAELAGQLATFIDYLATWKSILSQEKKLSDWLPICQCLLDDFFKSNEQIKPIFNFILHKWQKVIEAGIKSKYEDKVPLSLIRDELVKYFDNEKINQKFFTGTINFCSLMSMNCIPFKVVCLLGMNDGIYPRSTQTLEFDLISEKPQRGDRKIGDNDRYFFLEALNSASQLFYVSYISNKLHGNQSSNPSLLINELLDYISSSFCLKGDEHLDINSSADRVKEHLIINHTTVPFARENYLLNNKYRSYAVEWLPIVKKKDEIPIRFCTTPLLPVLEYENKVLLENMLSFYKHPIRAFFQQRLRVNFLNKEIQLLEHEPFNINNIQRYKINERLLKSIINEKSIDEIFTILQATGELPVGNFGRIYLEKQLKDMQSLVDKIKINQRKSFNKIFVESFKNTSLVGELRDIQRDGVIRYRPANLTISDGMSLWIEHLIFCIIVGVGKSYFWGRNNSEWCFVPIDKSQAKIYLEQLIKGYQEGMNTPLPLFLKSGWNWLVSCYNKNTNQFDFKSDFILKKAEKKFFSSLYGTYKNPGEIKDNYIRRAFTKMDNTLFVSIQKQVRTYLLPMILFKEGKCNFKLK